MRGSMRSHILIVACLYGSLAMAPVNAALVVDWSNFGYVNEGGDGVTLNRLTPASPMAPEIVTVGGSLPFDLNTPLNPQASFNSPAGKSATFYGGFGIEGTGNRGIDVRYDGAGCGVRDSSNGDTITVRYEWPNGGNGANLQSNTIGMAIVFKKSDFLGGASGGTISLDSSSVFTISAHANNSTNPNFTLPADGVGGRQRIIVQNGSQWYIGTSTATDSKGSQANSFVSMGSSTINDTGDFPRRKLQFSDIVWKQYDPFASVLMNDASFAAAPAYNGTFNNVQALGAYVQTTNASNDGNLRTSLTLFRVDSTVSIPEPTNLAAAGGAVAMLLRRRRIG